MLTQHRMNGFLNSNAGLKTYFLPFLLSFEPTSFITLHFKTFTSVVQHSTKENQPHKSPIDNSLLNYLIAKSIGKPKTAQQKRASWLNRRYKNFAPLFLDQMKPRLQLLTSALSDIELPPPNLPEIAFAGRSNCGKSTLINELTGRHCIAPVNKRPGSTQKLYFYQVGKPAMLRLVDLPGYGFADAQEEKRLHWTEFMLYYLKARLNLKRVMVLIDSRHGLKPADKELLMYFNRYQIHWQLVYTKSDLVPLKLLYKRLQETKEELSHLKGQMGPIIPLSALCKQNLDDLRKELNSFKKIISANTKQNEKFLITPYSKETTSKSIKENKNNINKEKNDPKKQKEQKEAFLDLELSRQAIQAAISRWGLDTQENNVFSELNTPSTDLNDYLHNKSIGIASETSLSDLNCSIEANRVVSANAMQSNDYLITDSTNTCNKDKQKTNFRLLTESINSNPRKRKNNIIEFDLSTTDIPASSSSILTSQVSHSDPNRISLIEEQFLPVNTSLNASTRLTTFSLDEDSECFKDNNLSSLHKSTNIPWGNEKNRKSTILTHDDLLHATATTPTSRGLRNWKANLTPISSNLVNLMTGLPSTPWSSSNNHKERSEYERKSMNKLEPLSKPNIITGPTSESPPKIRNFSPFDKKSNQGWSIPPKKDLAEFLNLPNAKRKQRNTNLSWRDAKKKYRNWSSKHKYLTRGESTPREIDVKRPLIEKIGKRLKRASTKPSISKNNNKHRYDSGSELYFQHIKLKSKSK